MKKIEAIVRPLQFEAVRHALTALGFHGFTFSQVLGMGTQTGYIEMYRGVEYKVNSLGRTKIELIVADDQIEICVDAILKASRTGNIGDGKIFIYPIERVVRIRTGEENRMAL